MIKVLFQGDSITDAYRLALKNSDGVEVLGLGYPNLIASQLSYENPCKFEFINRAVSGNKILDLYARWKRDCINIEPDIVSILVGVNDIWHEINYQTGIDAEKFEMVYSLLIEETKKELPNTKIILLEPFITHGTATDKDEQIFFPEIKKRQKAVSRIAEKYNLPLVKLQDKFDAIASNTDASHLTAEGVHPTQFGHEIIKRAWLETFEKII